MNKKFKLTCPTGYQVTNYLDDNLDICLVMRSGKVYSATLFTVENISTLMKKLNDIYFSSKDMLIVKNLERSMIRQVFSRIVEEEYEAFLLQEIGDIKLIYGDVSFDELKDNLSDEFTGRVQLLK